jgi:excisionase family DNA binding protein
LSTAEASSYIGVTLRTLYKLIDEGDVTAYKIGRVIRIKREDLDNYLQDVRIKPGSLEHLHISDE